MNKRSSCLVFLVLLAGFSYLHSNARGPNSQQAAKDRARILRAQPLPQLDGQHLKVVLLEIHYGPGEASPPHTHPCAAIGYVSEGTLRTQVKGEAEHIYKAGESFYEAPNGVHLVSANASSTAPARLLAYLICDREATLSTDVPAPQTRKQGEQ